MNKTAMLGLTLISLTVACAPMHFKPATDGSYTGGTMAAAMAQCRAETQRDLQNSASPFGVALGSRSRATSCMAGKGFTRVD